MVSRTMSRFDLHRKHPTACRHAVGPDATAKLIHNCWDKNQQSALGQFSIGRVGQFSISANRYVFENVEIATYTVLIAAAKAAGDKQTQAACEQILPQEEAMANWLLQHLPELTEAFLQRSENPDLEAKK
jgi:ferritin-like metal-binding protein YciE